LARKMLGYSPKVTLKDGLPKNIEWQLKATRSEAMRVYQRQRRNLLRYS
jgi:hypothetical protein